jgi:hypothetical protein
MYQENDDISNLFRDNEHLLDERPSRNAWAKLEEKLDQEKVKSTRRIYRYISTAAAVVAVVAMLSAIALFRDGDALMAEKNAKNEVIALNEQSTELSINDNTSDWRKEYAPESIEQEEEEVVEKENSTVTKPIIVKKEKVIAADNIVVESKPKARIATPEKTQIAPTISTAPVAKPKAEEAEVMAETLADAAPTKDNYNNFDTKIITNSSDDIITAREEKVATARKYEESAKMNSNTYNGDYGELAGKESAKKAKAEKPTINTFVWLKGAWSDNTALGLSYEKWEQTDKKTLTAKGYLIQNGDTLFVEQMEIKEIRNSVYYIASFEQGKAPTKFELVSYINGVSTFENPNSEFPSQIILQKDGNGYLITFENSNDFEQNKQLQYRNNISKARASRRMSRSGY